MSLPVLTFREKQAVAERYRDGESMPQLAEAYGCGVGVVHRVLIQMGVPRRKTGGAFSELNPCRECERPCSVNAVKPLCPACAKRFCQDCDEALPADWHTRLCRDCKFRSRYKRKEPRLCRICGRLAGRSTRRPYCGVHRRWFCSACDQPLPPTRINRRCTVCEQARKVPYWERPGARCSQCGEPRDGNHASRCRKCVAEEYEVRRWATLFLVRPCVECGEGLPKGRRLPRCVVCQRKVERRRRKDRMAVGAHRCAMCHDPLALKHGTYCPGCSTMLAKWRQAWHENDPVARSLGAVRPTRRWQEQQAA